MTDVASEIANAYEAKLNKIGPAAVWIQLGLMSAIGAGAVILFSLLRPKNSVVYQPKVKYSEDTKRPPVLDKGYLSWIKPLLATHESTLMDSIGLDAVCFLRFLRMARNMFICVATIVVVILLPINLVYNLKDTKTSDLATRTYLTMITIQAVRGSWLWAHVTITYVITLVAYYFIWINYAAMVKLKWQWFRSEEYQNSLHSRSIIITQVAKNSKSDTGIAQLLSSLNIPYPTTAVHIGRKVGVLPELIEAHNAAVRALEGVLTRYFKDPDQLPTNRPSMRIGATMGCGGQKVDAIDYLTEKIKRYDQRIEATRLQIGEKKPENYGFASFEAVPYAHLVAKKLEGRRKKGSHFALAPVPKDIIWENITMLDSQRTRSNLFGGVILVVFCFFYTLPLIAVSFLANLAALSSYVTFINTWVTEYPLLMSAFVGIVPPLLSVLLQLFLPIVIRWISTFQGATTHSQSDRTVTARYSAFLFITQFFIFSIVGVIIQLVLKVVVLVEKQNATADTVWAAIKTLPANIQNTWIVQSTYWLTVFPLRGASALFDLAQVVSLLLVWFRTKLFGRTPREIREWTTPPVFDYPVYFSNHLLILIVGFVYAPLAPLVPLFAAAAFAISYLVYKYQLMYVSISRVETGGRLWRVVINRVLVALIMMQAVMLLTIGLQRGWYSCFAVAPTIVSVIVFKVILSRKFDTALDWFIPGEAEMSEVYLHQADARKHRLEKRFGHPSLHETLITPMLPKSVQHLLPTIYNGRITKGHGAIDGKTVAQETAGGLTFNMLEEHDLAYDRTAYLRQRDEDAMTVSTAFAGQTTNGPGDDYFNQRRAAYLKNGATPGGGTPDGHSSYDLPNELSRMPTTGSGGSTDNLISYPPRYESPAPRLTHRANPSQQSFDSGSYGGSYYHGGELMGPPGNIGMGPQEVIEMTQPQYRSMSRPASPGGGGMGGLDARAGAGFEPRGVPAGARVGSPPTQGAGGRFAPAHRSGLSQQSMEGYRTPPPRKDSPGSTSAPPGRVATTSATVATPYSPLALDDELDVED